MSDGPFISTPRARLVPLDAGTARAIAGRQRGGRDWAPDFPADGDVVVATLLVRSATGPGLPDTDPADEPWRQPWLVLLDGSVVGTVGSRALRTTAGSRSGTQRGITEVTAETLTGNRPSQRVLEKLGFVRTGQRPSEEGELITWRLRVTVAAGTAPA